MARRQLIRRMIGTSFSRAEDALAWGASRTLEALALVDVVRVEGPRKVRELVRHPVHAVRSALEAWPGARAGRDASAQAVERAEDVMSRPKRKAAPRPAVVKEAPPVEAAEEHLPRPTDPEFRVEAGGARVTTTSRGRKTVPISVAAARKARAKIVPKPGFKPKHGQKKH